MIRLAIVAPRHKRCGIADYARLLAEALQDYIQVQWIELQTGKERRAWRDAARMADSADLVHIHFEYGLFDPVKPFRNRYADFMQGLKAPAVVTLHDRLPELGPSWDFGPWYEFKDIIRHFLYNTFFRGWERRQYQLARHCIAHNQEIQQTAIRFMSSRQVTLMHHPVPRTSIDWKLEKAETGCLVTPGFIKLHKGYETVLELLPDRPSWRWIWAGSAQTEAYEPDLERLKSTVEQKSLAQQVQMTGYLDRVEMERTMARAKIAVFPYRWVSGSGAMAWAIGMGMPVVASDLPPFRMVKEAGAGIELVPPDESMRWGEVIEALLNQPDRLQALAQKNIQYAEKYSYERTAEVHAELFRSLLSNQSGEMRPSE